MNLTQEQKAELKALSKEVFGSSSKWQKLYEKGQMVPVTEEVTEYVPPETEDGEGFTRKVQVPVKKGNTPLMEMKRYSYEGLREYMLNLKAKRDEIMAQIKKMQEEAKAKQAREEQNQKVQDELYGSAI